MLIKNYNHFLNEATLIGQDISYKIEEIRSTINEEKFDENLLKKYLNWVFRDDHIYFCNQETASEIFSNYKYRDNSSHLGMIFATTSPEGYIFIIVNDKELLYSIYEDMSNTLFKIKSVINHELVHREQYKKIGNKTFQIISNMRNNKKHNYNEEPRELMAYARNIYDELNKYFEKDEILDYLRSGGYTLSSTQKFYKENVDEKSYRKLLKHLYNYVTNQVRSSSD